MQADDWLSQVVEAPLDPRQPIIDAHHHLWDRPGHRYLVDELLADMRGGPAPGGHGKAGHNIAATVFMQIETAYRDSGPLHLRPVGETVYTNAVADAALRRRQADKHEPLLCAGIVGYADLTDEAVGETLDAHMAAAPARFRGVREKLALRDDRIMAVKNPIHPTKQFADPALRHGIAQLTARNLSLDVFIFHPQLRDLAALARDFPDTAMVLDHIGTPVGVGPYAGRQEEVFAEWKKDIADLARCPNVTVKLGGTAMPYNGFGWEHRPRPPSSEELAAATRGYYLHVIDCFSPARCMFESNFPVDRWSCSYTVEWNSYQRIAVGFSETEKSALFFNTAARVYRLDLPANIAAG